MFVSLLKSPLSTSAISTHLLCSPSKYNRNTTAAATGTRSYNDNNNGNRDTQTTTQHRNAERQQSFSIINNVDTSSIKSITNTFFPPSGTGRPQQHQLQLERNPTMTMGMGMGIVTRKQTQQRNADREQSFSSINNADMSSIKIMTTITSFFQRS